MMLSLGRAATAVAERRTSQRYTVQEVEAELSWHDGDQHCYASAVILDLSLGGALVLADAQPPATMTCWLRLRDDRSTEWCEVVVLQSRRVRSGHFLVRLKFRGHCPYDFFKQAVYGTDLRGRPEGYSPEFETRAWR